jgi:hypothetical protein
MKIVNSWFVPEINIRSCSGKAVKTNGHSSNQHVFNVGIIAMAC